MKKITLTIGVLFYVITESLCCVCNSKPDYHSKSDLLEYEFISLVRVSKIDSVENQPNNPIHRIEFEIIELYKGEKTNTILVDGGHRKVTKKWTSCDLGENEGEEWVLFAYYDKATKRLITHSCTRTFRYKNSDGYRYKGYGDEITGVEKLNLIFNGPTKKQKYEGIHIGYYQNGQKEIEENYKKGKHDGQRLLWYPSGQLESKQYFNKGKRNGIYEWYSKNGQLTTKEKFKNGHKIDTTTHWYEIDTSKLNLKLYTLINKVSRDSAINIFSTIQVWSTQIYNKKGELIYSIGYERNGVLDSEKICNPKKHMDTVRYYHTNGALKAEQYSIHNEKLRIYKDVGIYREWDETGKQIKYWEYDKNGIQIKESIKLNIE